jgi:hypothetical protein
MLKCATSIAFTAILKFKNNKIPDKNNWITKLKNNTIG